MVGAISTRYKNLRAWYWRIILGVVSENAMNSWVSEITEQATKYFIMKQNALPNLQNVNSDPLFVTATSEDKDDHWRKYYQVCIGCFTDGIL